MSRWSCRRRCGFSRYQRWPSGSGVENRFNVDSRGDRRIGVGDGEKCDQQRNPVKRDGLDDNGLFPGVGIVERSECQELEECGRLSLTFAR